MILEAKYTGPFHQVTVPGYQHRVAVRGEVVKIRIREGFPLGACWEITKGKKAYDSGLKEAQAKLEVEAKEWAAKKKAAAEIEAKKMDKIVEAGQTVADEPKPVKKGAKS